MNYKLGKFLTLFFAACFLAIQFFTVGDTQLEQNANQRFYIEDTGLHEIDKSIDNKFIKVDAVQSTQSYLSQAKTNHSQTRQLIFKLERPINDAFQKYMQKSLAVNCQNYQNKLFTTFKHLLTLKLSLAFNPILISNFKQVYSDESDSYISLS